MYAQKIWRGGVNVPNFNFTEVPQETLDCGECVYFELAAEKMPCRECAGVDISSDRSYFKQKK